MAQRVLKDAATLGNLVESVVVTHLRRAFGERVVYWRPDSGKEIDAVVVAPGQTAARIEVKYRSRFDRGDIAALIDSGGGLVLGLSGNRWWAEGRVYESPVHQFLASLDAPALSTRLSAGALRM
jgi:hypothetical protein